MKLRFKYPDEWYDTIRPAILKRDNYTCKGCGIKHRTIRATKKTAIPQDIDRDEISDYTINGWRVTRVLLHVCHIDNNKTNCSSSNLISKCPSCHAKMDAGHRNIMRKSRVTPLTHSPRTSPRTP